MSGINSRPRVAARVVSRPSRRGASGSPGSEQVAGQEMERLAFRGHAWSRASPLNASRRVSLAEGVVVVSLN